MKLNGHFPRLIATALLACLGTVMAIAQTDYDKVQIKVTQVSGNVYMLEGSGGNIGVCVGDDGIVIVDDEFAPLAPKIRAALKTISDKPIKFVMNTHFHGDHTGGNTEFGGEATIVAHDNVRRRLHDGGMVGGNEVKPAAKVALPVVTFNESATIHFNGEDIRALHFANGHTDGDSVIFFTQAKVIHMGDDFVTYGFPFVDADNGGTVNGMIAANELVLSMIAKDVKIIPGHGALSTPDDMRKFVAILKDTESMVAAAIKQGKTPEQMKKENLLAKYEDMGKGFIKSDGWIDLLYAEQTKNATDHVHAAEKK